MVNNIDGIGQLVQSIPGVSSGNPLLSSEGGFGPDYIVDLNSQLYGDTPGFAALSQLSTATTNTLQSRAAAASSTSPVLSQQQADKINGLIQSAAEALSDGDYESATQRSKELLKLDHTSGIAYHLLGRIAAAQGDLAGARNNFQIASNLAPQNLRFAEDLFNTRQLQRGESAALATAQEMVTRRDSALNGIRLLFELTARSSQQGRIHLAIGEGFATLNQPVQQLNAYEGAVEVGTEDDLRQLEGRVKQFIAQHAPTGLAYSILGRTQQRLGKFSEAIAALERARSIAPQVNRYSAELANVYATLGNIALSKQQFDTAEYRFERARELDYSNVNLKYGLAAVKISKAQYELERGLDNDARALLNRAAALLGDDESFNSELAASYALLGDRAAAEGLENLALLNYEAAHERKRDLSGLDRKIAQIHRDLAQDILDEHGTDLSTRHHEDIVSHYETAYGLFPSRASYKHDLAQALNSFGLKLVNENQDYERAVEMFGRARELYPENTTYLDNYNQALTLLSLQQ